MSSQQNQILGDFDHEDIIESLYRNNETKHKKQLSDTMHRDPERGNVDGVKDKFNIKKFQHHVLKQIINKNVSQKPLPLQSSSNIKSNRNLKSHANNYKQITQQRKLSKSKSKSKKSLTFNQINKDTQVFNKTHQTNIKILRQKILSDLSYFDDYEMINIEDSIPILKQAKILKILTSLQETKTKIQSKQLPQGRIKQEAKFIYFLWKMIDEETISARHLKEIILLLNELNKNQLIQAFNILYSRDGEIVLLFVQCWLKLKLDRFSLPKNSSRDKNLSQNPLNSSKLINLQNQQSQKTLKKIPRSKTQCCDLINIQSPQIDENQKNIKFLNPDDEKKLIQRLYEERKDFMSIRERVKTLHDEEKENLELQKCTFKPLLMGSVHKRSSSRSNLMLSSKRENNLSSCMNMNSQESIEKKLEKRYESKEKSTSKVKGFEKAVVRMKNGQSQTKLKQQLLAYHSVGENYEKIKQKPMNPPKFLQREKQKKQEMVLFVIQFEIGRHKVKVKIHPTDTEISVSKKISKIYALKPEQEEEIREIVSMELNNYYKSIVDEVSEFIEEN